MPNDTKTSEKLWKSIESTLKALRALPEPYRLSALMTADESLDELLYDVEEELQEEADDEAQEEEEEDDD